MSVYSLYKYMYILHSPTISTKIPIIDVMQCLVSPSPHSCASPLLAGLHRPLLQLWAPATGGSMMIYAQHSLASGMALKEKKFFLDQAAAQTPSLGVSGAKYL